MFENFKESMRARVAPTGDHISALRQDLRSRLQGFKAQRTTTEQARLEQDFSQVLRAWGIDDAALIPAVLRELRLRILIFALPVAVHLGGRYHPLASFRAHPATIPALCALAVLTRRPFQDRRVRRLQ